MLGGAYLDDVTVGFRKTRRLAEAALEQLDDGGFFAVGGPDENAVATIVKHVAGNQRSRWTDFLTTDGEKPDRNRDGEFEIGPDDSRASLMDRWEAGWALLEGVLAALEPDDLSRTVTIRGEPHTVLQALQRQLAHYSYHVGQIVLLARHHVGADWKSLSIPKGKSAEFEVDREGRPYEAS